MKTCLTALSILLTSFASLTQAEGLLSKIISDESAMVTVRGQHLARNDTQISFTEKSGAGVVINEQGYIATNTHIIYGANIISIVLANGTTYNAQIILVSPEYDFSILKITPQAPLQTVAWAPYQSLSLGDPVVTMGHSPFLDRTLSGGTITGMGTRTLPNGEPSAQLIRLNINHYRGDSGGPVFNRQGQFVGIISAKRLSVPKEVFAIPADRIREAFENNNKPI